MKKETTKKMVYAAMFIAIGIILPFFTGQIPQIGNLLLPMHIPVFVCGLICGWQSGFAVGMILPLLRSFIFGRPVFYPSALAMAMELATYGFISGIIYNKAKRQTIGTIYSAMLTAMLAGRVVWGLVELVLVGLSGSIFTWQMFFAGAFLNAIPGIILQLTLIPAIVLIFKWAGIADEPVINPVEERNSQC